jgi:hypothetical protein
LRPDGGGVSSSARERLAVVTAGCTDSDGDGIKIYFFLFFGIFSLLFFV